MERATLGRECLQGRSWRRIVALTMAGALLLVLLSGQDEVMSQRAPVVVRAAIAGEVVPDGLAQVGQMVTQGAPLVYVRTATGTRPALAAVAPVAGQIVNVMVGPGSHIGIGEPVAAIQPR